MTAIPLLFASDPPGVLTPHDEVVLPDTIQRYDYVTFERVGLNTVAMFRVPTGMRWVHPGPLYQLDRPVGRGGLLLRFQPPGRTCDISWRALRRIRGHGRTVAPSNAFGFLLGSPDRGEIHAALPVGRTRILTRARALFEGVEAALPLAQALVAERGLAIAGLYCAPWSDDVAVDGRAVPSALQDGYLFVVPRHGVVWSDAHLYRMATPHGWLTCAWRSTIEPIPSAQLNPRRINSAWIRIFGPMDYSRDVPEPPPEVAPGGSHGRDAAASRELVSDWFSAERQPAEPSALPAESRWLAEAVAAKQEIRIRYGGGSMPGAERTILPEALFKVTGYDAVYLRAMDVDLDEERVFRLDRIELPGFAEGG